MTHLLAWCAAWGRGRGSVGSELCHCSPRTSPACQGSPGGVVVRESAGPVGLDWGSPGRAPARASISPNDVRSVAHTLPAQDLQTQLASDTWEGTKSCENGTVDSFCSSYTPQ